MSEAGYRGRGTIGGKICLGIVFLAGFLIFDPVFEFLVGHCFSEGCGKFDQVVVFSAALVPFILVIPIGLLARTAINRLVAHSSNSIE